MQPYDICYRIEKGLNPADAKFTPGSKNSFNSSGGGSGYPSADPPGILNTEDDELDPAVFCFIGRGAVRNNRYGFTITHSGESVT